MDTIPLGLRHAMAAVLTDIRKRIFGNAVATLNNYFDKLKPSMLIASSPDFRIGVLEFTLISLLPHTESKNRKFREILCMYLKHWISFAGDNCPKESLIVFQSILDGPYRKSSFLHLLGPLATIIGKLSPQDQLRLLPPFQRYLLASPIDVIPQIPEAMWHFLAHNLSENEIASLLFYLTKSPYVLPAVILSQLNTSSLIPVVLCNTRLDYLCHFLVATSTEFDVVPLITTSVDTLNLDPCESQKHALRLLYFLLDHVNDSNREIFMPAWSRVRSKTEDPVLRRDAFKLLCAAEIKGLYPYESLKTLFDFNDSSLHKHILRVIIGHSEDAIELFGLLNRMVGERQLTPVIRLFSTKFTELSKLNETEASRLFKSLFCPLPTSPKDLEAIAELILVHEPEVATIQRFIYHCSKLYKSEKTVVLLTQIITKCQLSVDFARFDWFGRYSYTNFGLLPDDNPSFIKELLDCKLLAPYHSFTAFEKMIACAELAAPIALDPCLSLLFTIASVMSDIEPPVRSQWFSVRTIRRLFNSNTESLSSSRYGDFVRCVMSAALKLLAASDEVPEETYSMLMLVCRRLGNAFPSATAPLVAFLHDSVAVAEESPLRRRFFEEEKAYFGQFQTQNEAVEKARRHCKLNI